jgi:hypothetical protein
MIDFLSFKDELVKIAESEKPSINKRTFRKFLENTALIAGGTAAGYGAGELTRRGLKRVVPSLSPGVRKLILAGTTAGGGVGAAYLKHRMDEEKNRRIEEGEGV